MTHSAPSVRRALRDRAPNCDGQPHGAHTRRRLDRQRPVSAPAAWATHSRTSTMRSAGQGRPRARPTSHGSALAPLCAGEDGVRRVPVLRLPPRGALRPPRPAIRLTRHPSPLRYMPLPPETASSGSNAAQARDAAPGAMPSSSVSRRAKRQSCSNPRADLTGTICAGCACERTTTSCGAAASFSTRRGSIAEDAGLSGRGPGLCAAVASRGRRSAPGLHDLTRRPSPSTIQAGYSPRR